jgi:ATP-dependent Zn protease
MVEVAERERVALHESCHAVVGLLAGIDVTGMSLDPPVTIFTPPPWTPTDYRKAVLQRLVMEMAPCAAQTVFGADFLLEDDLEQVWTLAPILDRVDPDACVRRLLAILQGIVAEYKKMIEQVAGALLIRGRLAGPELRQIMATR